MNVEGARLARQARGRGDGDRFVAGSIGPLNVTLSLSPRVDDPAYRAVTFDEVYEAYAEQIRGLAEGGADLLLIETIFDTLNAKAAIAAAHGRRARAAALDLGDHRRPQRPHALGPDARGLLDVVEHAEPADRRRQLLARRDARCARSSPTSRASRRTYVRCYPNAGLPNAFGGYDEEPDDDERAAREFAEAGLVNVVGGCCGTTPEHIARDRRGGRGCRAADGRRSRRPRRASAGSSRSRSARTPAS